MDELLYNPLVISTFLSQINVWTVLLFILVVFLLSIFLPIKGKFVLSKETPNSRFDERDTMFSRLEISRDKQKQEKYYSKNPDIGLLDKSWLSKPGLLSPDSVYYDPLSFTAADASFITIGHLRSHVDGEVHAEKKKVSPEKMTDFIINWGKKLGAVSMGITKMHDSHYYSHRGRGEAYGKKVETSFKYGIALTVEMDEELLATGPAGPSLLESAHQYVNSGVIAVQIAQFIRDLGYEARAHIDGNYELIAPLVARDAGLGELGRMGLLMTPKLGPRVRIAVVTTNAPLKITERIPDYTVHDFCNICKKCAVVCPSQAIQKTPIEVMDGAERWKINHEKCFGYWCTSGTDCGRCMSVCPYAHKNNWLHDFVRWGIRNNYLFRRLAVYGDDMIYGKKPKPKEPADWMVINNNTDS